MPNNLSISPWRILLPISLGTALSLMGDTTLYAVLPTNVAQAGVTVASVGILLSVNRFIRLALNGPIGWLYDRSPRRYLFIVSLFLGAISTAFYALTQGFWPLLIARLLWGGAWAGIWIGGNAMIFDISHSQNRGRWVGIYQTSFFLGASGGAILGGVLTDWVGYHQAMGIGALLTLSGAVAALLFLPETRNLRQKESLLKIDPIKPKSSPALKEIHSTKNTHVSAQFWSVLFLLGINRFVIAGVLLSTYGLFLLQHIDKSFIFETNIVGTITLGVASLTGLVLGVNSLLSLVSAPMMGWFSDRVGSRWGAIAWGLIPGILGFGLLASPIPWAVFFAPALTAITSGSSQSLATTLVGDLSTESQRGQRLGILFTIGDLSSAIGPPLAYFLMPLIGLQIIYLLSGILYAIVLIIAIGWAKQR